MSEIEEMGHFEQGVWIPQPIFEVLPQQQGMSFQYPQMNDNIWMIMVRLEKIESHLYRLERLLETIDTEIRWRR